MENIEKIHALLEEFSFQELSEVQKELVLTEFSEPEYKANRDVILNLSAGLDENIDFESKPFAYPTEMKENVINKVLNYKIPVYKLVAGLALVLISGYLIKISLSEKSIPIASTVQVNEESTLQTQLNKFNSNNSLLHDTISKFLDFVTIVDR